MRAFDQSKYIPDFANVHDACVAPSDFWPMKTPEVIQGTTLERRNQIVHALLCNVLVTIDGAQVHRVPVNTHDAEWGGHGAGGEEIKGPQIDAAKKVIAWVP